MKQFLTTLLFCCLTFLSFGQQNTIDSLQQLLSKTTPANEQIPLYYQLAVASLKINPPQAIQYSYRVQALLDNKPSKLKAKIYRIRAMATFYSGQPLQAAAILDTAIVLLPPTSSSYLDTINDSRGQIYYRLAVGFIQKEPQKTIEYANKIIHIIPQSKSQQLSVAYNVKAGAYHALAQYDSAVFFLDSSLHYIQQVQDTIFKQSETATIYSNQAAIYVYQRRYQKAATLFYKAIDVYEALGMPDRKAIILNNLSGIYTYLNEPQTAIQYIKKAIAIELSNTNTDTLELCNSYYNLAIMHINDKFYDTSLVYLDKVIPFYNNNQYYEKLALCYVQKSFCYDKLDDLPKATAYSKQAAALETHFSAIQNLQELRQMQAKLYRKTGQLEKSKQLYSDIIDSMNIYDPVQKIESLKGGIKTALLAKDFELAYNYDQQKNVLKDSLAGINKENVIRDLEVKYQTKEIQQQNEVLKKEQEFRAIEATQNRRLLYLTTGIAILLIGLLLLLLQYNIAKSSLQKKELKFQLLRNQMNPHFLFNVLGAIQSFIYTNNPIKAGDFLSSFAILVRAILDNSTEEYIPISKEIEWLENYVSLQALRFEENLKYTISIDPQLQEQEFLIPPMLIQPFIENALEHGFKDIDYQGELTINMTLQEEVIAILIKDNGLGFDPDQQSNKNKKHLSHATRITKERLNLLRKKGTKNIVFKITSAPQQGTSVLFHLPFDN